MFRYVKSETEIQILIYTEQCWTTKETECLIYEYIRHYGGGHSGITRTQGGYIY